MHLAALRALTETELLDAIQQAQEEMDSLMGELIRRSPNVYLLNPRYEGPSVA